MRLFALRLGLPHQDAECLVRPTAASGGDSGVTYAWKKRVSALRSHGSALLRHLELGLWVRGQVRSDLRGLTMVPEEGLRGLAAAVDRVTADGVAGCFVECGTWRGGASFLMARRLLRNRIRRCTWLFDSFEGLPPPASIDGPAALAWAKDTGSPSYHDNCTASLEEVEASVRRLGLQDHVQVVKGWFEETLPATKARLGPIALLRIDADWYESVTTCLEELVPQVSPGGIVILDDYRTWDGCTRATHDYLSRHGLPYRIDGLGGASFRIRS